MPTRWEVKDAMYRSTLCPLDRLVLHTLIARSETSTAVIPAHHQPSIRVLVHETGMGKHTLQRALARLESEGWIEVGRPTKGEQLRGASNAYAVTIPDPYAQSGPTEGCTQTGPTGVLAVGPPVGPERVQGWARSGPLSTSPSPEISPSSSETLADDPWSQQERAAATGRRFLTEDQKADALAMNVPCHYCDSLPGNPCRQRRRPWVTVPHTHQARRDLATQRRTA